MFLLTISETTVRLSFNLLIYLWKALPEQNINMWKYINNALLLLNPMGPVFSNFHR